MGVLKNELWNDNCNLFQMYFPDYILIVKILANTTIRFAYVFSIKKLTISNQTQSHTKPSIDL